MINRYHREIGFNQDDLIELKNICQRFTDSTGRFNRTNHALEKLSQRFDYMKVLSFIQNDLQFNLDEMFEYYKENGKITKVVLRVSYTDTEDMIIVLARNKTIITAYINNKLDNHVTLNPRQYTKV